MTTDETTLNGLGFRIDSSGGSFLLISNIDSGQVEGGNLGSINVPDFTATYNAAVATGITMANALLADQAAQVALGQAPLGVNPGSGFWDTE
jgi:hypothetical protein